jgi:hypothetical protein
MNHREIFPTHFSRLTKHRLYICEYQYRSLDSLDELMTAIEVTLEQPLILNMSNYF